MAWLLRMAGLRDLRRDDGVSDVSATVLGDGMSNENKFWHKAALSQSKWVQQLESENELARCLIEKLERELAAEKALADGLHEGARNYRVNAFHARDKSFIDAHTAYRKARGME